RLEIPPAYVHYYYFRHVVGRIFNGVVRLLLLPGVADSQAGLKGFRAAAAERLFSGWLPRGFSFDIALLFRARRLGLRIESVPVLYRYENTPSTVRWARDSGRMLRDVVQIRLRLVGDRFEQWSNLRGVLQARYRARFARWLGSESALVAMLAAFGGAFMLLPLGRFAFASNTLAVAAWMVMIGVVLLVGWRIDLRQRARP